MYNVYKRQMLKEHSAAVGNQPTHFVTSRATVAREQWLPSLDAASNANIINVQETKRNDISLHLGRCRQRGVPEAADSVRLGEIRTMPSLSLRRPCR